jgi:hypothetical protein
MHLSPHDSGLLRADPLRGRRRQYGCLGAGIEEKKDRCAIGETLTIGWLSSIATAVSARRMVPQTPTPSAA